ncbi:MAG: SulP family inorganic anion transporter [Bacteroidetes bacterium]|nr:SulP family inorganic anion transporter [Bacteroidota bacterium]
MFKNFRDDFPASIVVFFVALPLCLGIALASGAQPFAGLIAGIIGGVLVGALSGSRLGVSGPAAGLIAVVAPAIQDFNYEGFLVAVVLAGILQIVFGLLKAGVIGYYFPGAVIKGMLAGIGVVIFIKELPHAVGLDSEYEGNLSFFQKDGENSLTELFRIFDYLSPSAVVIALIALLILFIWDKYLSKKHRIFQLISGPMIAVVAGIIFELVTRENYPEFALSTDHLVKVPVASDAKEFASFFTFPDWGVLAHYKIYVTAITIAIVASLETLLCVEATDKMDSEKRVTPTNRELLAQGAGNVLSGLIGGIPVTQVIVRSTANMQSGAKTKLSAIFHGLLLLLFVILIPDLLNLIPRAVLAAILLRIGYKLANPKNFRVMYLQGRGQFIPFIVTIAGIMFTDLLYGIALGLGVGTVMLMANSFQNSYFIHEESGESEGDLRMRLPEQVSFINKGAIQNRLNQIPEGSHLIIDLTKTLYMDKDVQEVIDDFRGVSKSRNIEVTILHREF